MDKAKAAVGNFMHKAGHHDTTVHEKVAPAVVQETVNKTRVEEQQTAIDKEVHQDHYHTSIQPVQDKEILPEQHHHRMAGVETREVNHGDDAAIRARLEQERAQFRDQRVEGQEQVINKTAPVIAGEHVHHHVHETIQPVVQKETIQPSVVHTTVPIHEVHHHEAKHHAASALPAVSMNEFRSQGGSLRGREERVDGFEGEPKPVASTLGAGATGTGMSGVTGTTGTTGTHGNTGISGAGPHDSRLANKADPRVDSDRDGSRNAGAATGATGSSAYNNNNTTGTTGYGSNTHGNTGVSGAGPHDSRMANKADPRVDSDRDGSRNAGAATGTTGSSAYGNTSSTGNTGVAGAGPHNSKMENKLDPRVDSNNDGRAGVGK